MRDSIGIKQNDIEVCTGDVINKGPNSKETLNFLQENNIKSVLGNHEEKILYYLNADFFDHRRPKPPALTKQEKNLALSLSTTEIKHIESMPYFLNYGIFKIVHGGVTEDMELDNLNAHQQYKMTKVKHIDAKDNSELLSKKDKDSIFWGDVYEGEHGFIIFGHNKNDNIIQKPHCLGLDTGCVYGGKLSAALIEDVNKLHYTIYQTPCP